MFLILLDIIINNNYISYTIIYLCTDGKRVFCLFRYYFSSLCLYITLSFIHSIFLSFFSLSVCLSVSLIPSVGPSVRPSGSLDPTVLYCIVLYSSIYIARSEERR